MHVSLALRTTVADSRIIRINCPVCGKEQVAAQVQDLRQSLLLFHFLPVFYHRPTLAKCLACGTELAAGMKAADLDRVGDPEHVARYLRVRLPLVLRTLVLGGIVAWLLPAIGTVWTGAGYWWSRRYSGWVRTLALVLFVLSLLPTSGLFLGSLLSHPSAEDTRDGLPSTPARGVPPSRP